jgi:hypothetical protein
MVPHSVCSVYRLYIHLHIDIKNNMAVFGVLLVIFGIKLLFAGIVLLILGLIFRKPKLWIPGSIIMGLLLITIPLVIVVSLSKLDEPKDYGLNDYNEYEQQYATPEPEESTTAGSDSISMLYDVPVSGYVEDTDKSMVYLTVYPDKFLKKAGISLINVGKASMGKDQQGIALELFFKNKFNGKMVLQWFDSGNVELGNDMLKVSQESGQNVTLEFRISRDVPYTEINHFTLTAFE